MARLLIIIIALVGMFYLSQWLRIQYSEKGRPFAVKALLVAIALVFVLLAAMGRAHWIGALLASVLAGLRFALPVLLRHLPLLHGLFTSRAQAKNENSNNHSAGHQGNDMSVDEALEVLGLDTAPTREQIIEAHRRLIQKIHPDRGGNDFLASTINKAKDVLIEHYF